MKKKIFCSIFLLIFFLQLPINDVAFAISLTNGDFESGKAAPWQHSSSSIAEMLVVSDEKHGGEKSLIVQSMSGTYTHYAKQRISGVNSEKMYRARAYVKRYQGDFGGAKLRIAWYGEDGGNQLSTKDSEQELLPGDAEGWKELTIESSPHANASSIEVRLMTKTTGVLAAVYYDDVMLEEFDPPTPMPTATLTSVPTDPPPTPTKTPTPTNAPTATKTPTQTPTPKKTATPTRIKTPTPTKKISPTPTKKILAKGKTTPTNLASEQKENSSGKVLGKEISSDNQELVKFFLLTAGLFGISAGGVYVYNSHQKFFDDFWRRKFKRE